MKKLRNVALVAALTIAATGAGVAGSAGATDVTATDVAAPTTACETDVATRTDVSTSLIAAACARLAAANSDSSGEAPTIVKSWTTFGATSSDGTAGLAGWPIKASCLILGAVTSPTTAYYVLAGEADTTGPATATRITCTASPSGLSFTQTLPGPAAAGFDVTTSLFPGSALAAQQVCSRGEAWYLIRPLYMSTGTLLAGCSSRLGAVT